MPSTTDEAIPEVRIYTSEQETSEPEASEAADQEMALSASPQISAKILCSSILFTGIEAWEDESARGDVTDELADFCQVAGASQAFRIGRVVLPAGFEDGLPVCATAVVSNNGGA